MNKTRFVVVDFEMANNQLKSICQLGLVVFQDFEIVSQWESLVNPNSDFGFYQSRVHGLKMEDVQDAPTIEELREDIEKLIADQVVCSFGMNDFHALNNNFALPSCKWMDVSKVVNRAWPELPKGQRNLKAVCQEKNIPLPNHHNALGDALATGHVLNRVMQEKQLDINDLLKFSIKYVTHTNHQEGLFHAGYQ